MALLSRDSNNALVSCLFAVFCLASPASSEPGTAIYAFHGVPDGSQPAGSLMEAADGSFYGTTSEGGTGTGCNLGNGCGTLFQVTDGVESVLHSFAGGCDGAFPYSGLISDSEGNYYGTTTAGGNCDSGGFGTVFKLAADGTESVLYAFKGGDDGKEPYSDLIADAAGNLFGTTIVGGSHNCGTVFKITPDGKEEILHTFLCGDDGGEPVGGLVRDKKGNFFGTTSAGGQGTNCNAGEAFGCGIVFKISPPRRGDCAAQFSWW